MPYPCSGCSAGWPAWDVVYRGDIDTHGFAILNRFRHHLLPARLGRVRMASWTSSVKSLLRKAPLDGAGGRQVVAQDHSHIEFKIIHR
jgi:hypothetical protein